MIPVVRVLRKAGVPGGTILAFAMSAPLFNPLSLLYGLTLSEPVAIVAFALCSLVIVTVVGITWDWMFPVQEGCQEESKTIAYGIRRMAAVGTSAARHASGVSWAYILTGLAGVAAAGAILPSGTLQHTFKLRQQSRTFADVGDGDPDLCTPMLAMSQLGMMFQHANSIGAAFVLLVLGAGMNLGLAAWMFRHIRVEEITVWFALLMAVVLALAYGVEKATLSQRRRTSQPHSRLRHLLPALSSSETGFWRLAEATKEKLNRDISDLRMAFTQVADAADLCRPDCQVCRSNGKTDGLDRNTTVATETQKMDFVLPPSVIACDASRTDCPERRGLLRLLPARR